MKGTMETMDVKQNSLYLITERDDTAKREVNFLYTSNDLFGPGNYFESPSKLEQAGDPSWLYLRHRGADPESHEWRLHKVDMQHSMPAAAHEIAEFLSGTHNDPNYTWETDTMRVTPSARQLLAELLQPVLAADFGSERWMYAHGAMEWVKENQNFVDDLDNIFSSLELITVNRIRPSATQGEAAVFCNGMEVVRYGDDMWLVQTDGSIHNAMTDETKPGPLYGPVIGGWGSSKPDEMFRKAAIAQYDSIVYDSLRKEPIRSIEIWQLGNSPEAVNSRFLGYQRNLKLNGSFRPDLYDRVWSGEVQANTLEDIYQTFNIAHPDDYKSASLSVSDVVKVSGRYYFCDSLGFRKIDFERTPSLEDRLQDAKNNTHLSAPGEQNSINGPDHER